MSAFIASEREFSGDRARPIDGHDRKCEILRQATLGVHSEIRRLPVLRSPLIPVHTRGPRRGPDDKQYPTRKGEMKMNSLISNRRMLACFAVSLFLLSVLLVAVPVKAASTNYGNVSLSGGFQAGHFNDVWDLTAGDITISFTYNANGLVDDAGTHAWAELGVRSLGSSSDFNPYWRYPVSGTDLIAGHQWDIGDVIVWRAGISLYVVYVVTEVGCGLTETHLAVANTLSGIPQTKKGNPIPGQFDYHMDYDPPVTGFTYVVPAPSGPVLYVAAHAVVTCASGEETAWAAGLDFPGKNWATYFNYESTSMGGSGVWLATDYDWTPNTFDPDPPGGPTLDLDDKLILQRQGGQGEGAYNLPSTPPNPWANHRVWWDRDGVDPWQNGETANTGGIYHVVITLHATSPTTGTAYMTINGLNQGFETDGDWNTIELTPAGMTFIGDMAHLQVFYGLYGYVATHTVQFSDITVTQ